MQADQLHRDRAARRPTRRCPAGCGLKSLVVRLPRRIRDMRRALADLGRRSDLRAARAVAFAKQGMESFVTWARTSPRAARCGCCRLVSTAQNLPARKAAERHRP